MDYEIAKNEEIILIPKYELLGDIMDNDTQNQYGKLVYKILITSTQSSNIYSDTSEKKKFPQTGEKNFFYHISFFGFGLIVISIL
ncbi:hypothetical protein, partial [Enterococcus sp. RIT-PI-f]|uniref:hypothetical protein n=1 Tax=Enterococcus sp. RIT-PI-f TaxID=1690244 RepID=UPI003561E0CD